MAIEVTVAQIKAAIKAIRSSFAKDVSPKLSQNLEEVSIAFGYPTWDALSGDANAPTAKVRVTPEEVSFPVEGAIEVYVQCDTRFDDEDVLIPDWFKLSVSSTFLARLQQMREVLLTAELSEVRKFFYNFQLQEGSAAFGSELVVGGVEKVSWFSVNAQLSANNVYIASRGVVIDQLGELVQQWIEEKRSYPMVLAGEEMAREAICEQLRDEGLLPEDVPCEVFPLI
jgi:hypothetical protein